MNSHLLISLGAMQTPWCRFCWWLCSPWLPLLRLLQELCCQNHQCSPSLGIAQGCFSINRSLESGFPLPVLFPAQIFCKISQFILSVVWFSTSFPIFGIPVCVISKLASMGSISTECICYGYWWPVPRTLEIKQKQRSKRKCRCCVLCSRERRIKCLQSFSSMCWSLCSLGSDFGNGSHLTPGSNITDFEQWSKISSFFLHPSVGLEKS